MYTENTVVIFLCSVTKPLTGFAFPAPSRDLAYSVKLKKVNNKGYQAAHEFIWELHFRTCKPGEEKKLGGTILNNSSLEEKERVPRTGTFSLAVGKDSLLLLGPGEIFLLLKYTSYDCGSM